MNLHHGRSFHLKLYGLDEDEIKIVEEATGG
jgi:hypothetical protein